MRYREGLSDRPSYDVTERDWKIKINANECNLNLPPLVDERVMNRLSHVAFNRYPNDEAGDLCEQIARNFGCQKENVQLGNGSSEIIEKLFYAFGGEGHSIVYPWPSFSMYPNYAKAAEANGVAVNLSEDDYSLDVDEYIRAVRESNATLAVVCNPNNPTGNVMPLGDIEKIAKATADADCAFLVDEAYVEFGGESAAGLMKKYSHMIIARTFSKAYGLASARVGYMLADSAMAEMFGKTLMPYHMNVLSTVVADIVYQMRDEYRPRIDMMISERKRVYESLGKYDELKVFPSGTNFILLKYDRAVALNERLEKLGIGVRSFGKAPGLTNCLRVSMGTREENDTLLSAIDDFVKGSV